MEEKADKRRFIKGLAIASAYTAYKEIVVPRMLQESSTELKKADSKVDMQARLSEYPASTVVSSYIFKKVAVQGKCLQFWCGFYHSNF
jgi:transcription initiation factor TFIIIB Brf1 subunit/transcription initiation factor TFIIB